MRHRFSCLVLCAVLLAAAIPAAAQPITVNPGDDGWVTPSGGTQVDLTAYPTTSVFGSAVTFSPSTVPLVGSPIDSAHLGSTDTIVERYNSVFLPAIGSTGTTSLEIQALRLIGNTAASNGKTYQVKVCLSEWHSGSLGTMNLKLTTPNGGSFTSSFPVLPKLIFTNVANPADKVVLDCGAVPGCPPITLNSSSCWVTPDGPAHWNPIAHGYNVIPAGIAVDGTCDGVADYTTHGSSNFVAGIDPTSFLECVSSHDSSGAAKHVTKPTKDCKATQGTGTAAAATGTASDTSDNTDTGTVIGTPVVIQPVPSYCLQQAKDTTGKEN